MGNALAEIRARLAAAEQKNNKTFEPNAVFPFWNAKTGSTSQVRFLPDGDGTNTFFWVERQSIKLPFNGVKGGEAKPVYVTVPCVEMWGRELYPQGCPILNQLRPMYEAAKKTGDDSLKQIANKYWKKPSYIMQGFVRDNQVAEDKAASPENPIRRFSLNKQIFNIVKAGLMATDMDNIPCDYENGTDFKIVKTLKGEYADYGTSSYSRKESPLTTDELAAIEKYGLSNLSDFMGKKPTEIELGIIEEMFEASFNGEAYDQEKWGNYYRPAGLKSDSDKTNEETINTVTGTTSTPEVQSEPETTPAVTSEAPKTASPSAKDILEKIRARKANNG